MSGTEYNNKTCITSEDQAQLDDIQQRAHTWRNSMLGSLQGGIVDPRALAQYREAMDNLRALAKPLAEKYPGNERGAIVFQQIEAWLQN